MQTVTFRCPDDLLSEVDEKVDDLNDKNAISQTTRTDLIVHALRRLLEQSAPKKRNR